MTTRREFLQGTMAVSGMAGIALAGTASASAFSSLSALSGDASAPLRLDGIVFETGIPHGAAFDSRANQLGLRVFPIEGDITRLWTGYLRERWRKQPVPLAGFTEAMPLFLLERFGWDHGLRVVFRAEHSMGEDGILVHRLEGPPDMLAAFQALAAGGSELGSCVAEVFASCPPTARSAITAMFTTAPAMPAMPSTVPAEFREFLEPRQTAPLYSWVIAPRGAFAALLP